MVDLDRQHVVLRARADGRALDGDIADALAAFDPQPSLVERIGREWVDEVDEKRALAVCGGHRLIIHDFEEVNPVEFRMTEQCLAATLIATDIDHRYNPPPRVNSAVRRSPLRRTLYCAVTRSAASSLSTSTASTSIRSPSHCCSAPCTRNRMAAASSSLFGAKTNCISPQPKSGRLTRSPGAVKRTCSIRSRMCASPSAAAVRPRPSK